MVCPSVCLSVRAITRNLIKLETWNFAEMIMYTYTRNAFFCFSKFRFFIPQPPPYCLWSCWGLYCRLTYLLLIFSWSWHCPIDFKPFFMEDMLRTYFYYPSLILKTVRFKIIRTLKNLKLLLHLNLRSWNHCTFNIYIINWLKLTNFKSFAVLFLVNLLDINPSFPHTNGPWWLIIN